MNTHINPSVFNLPLSLLLIEDVNESRMKLMTGLPEFLNRSKVPFEFPLNINSRNGISMPIDTIEKIMEIDSHLGCAMSGLTADARTMIDHARVTAQNHSFTYDERIKVESVTQAVCDLALRFGESVSDEEAMMSRPFGVALLIAGIDEQGSTRGSFAFAEKMNPNPLIVRGNNRLLDLKG